MTPETRAALIELGFLPEEKTGPRTEADVMHDLRNVECQLSPENLSCDGELRGRKLQQKAKMLNARKADLIKELGRTPTDSEIWGEP